ncbi:hypothetical protein [Porphyrobacter sp. AAP82]|uniref:hypothetical protein n=1 Tax=Porphyrobacter sp. AAP82 TaxID=1248917 RepID=UPI00031A12FB|nr:hypothetical protein [Porphyrobacter sp. AAP82]
MIGRIVWLAALAGIALLTAGLQLDFGARGTPQLVPLVPEPLRNFAQVHVAMDALATKTPGVALAETRKLVRRRPIPSENLLLLAAAQARAGETETAGQTIQIAGKRGWREPVAQEAVLRIALAAGDRAEAARRYVALFLRNETPDALLGELGPAIVGAPGGEGQATMVAIVVRAERWRSRFLRRGVQVLPPAAFAEMATASLEKGADFDCRSLETSITQLKRSDAAAAAQLARAGARSCPKAGALAL